jgi:prevent-host-death family protein
MTKWVTAAQANQQFSALMGEVESGEEVIVTKRGKPAVRLVRFDAEDEARLARKAALAQHLERMRSRPVTVYPWTDEDMYP